MIKSILHSFLNPKVKIYNSLIEGRGFFAKEKIKKGEIISIAEGNILTLNEMKNLSDKWQDWCYGIDGTHFLCAEDFNNIALDWYLNHSCDPNCGLGLDCYTFIAMRDIEEGEEITYDYAMTESESNWLMKCCCGAKICRKIITGDDWKKKELQERYKGFFQKYIQERIDAINNY